jgi:hypothetical protein
LLSARDEWRRALERWRVSNGALRLDKIEIGWDASKLIGSGRFAIDDSNRIDGDLRMQLSDADQWKPTHLVQGRFTSALQEIANAVPPSASASPVPFSLDFHNGAAIVSAAGRSRAAGSIDSMF